jgi:hypothetical protein
VGVEYRHFVLPSDRTTALSPELAEKLVSALLDDGWLPRAAGGAASYPFVEDPDADEQPAYAHVRAGSQLSRVPAHPSAEWFADLPPDAQLIWLTDDVVASGMRYPFTCPEYSDASLAVIVQRSADYAFDPALTEFDVYRPTLLQRLSRRLRGDRDNPIRCPRCTERLDYPAFPGDPIAVMRIRFQCGHCGGTFDPSGLDATAFESSGRASRMKGGIVHRFAVIFDCEKSVPGPQPFTISADVRGCIERALGQPVVDHADWY